MCLGTGTPFGVSDGYENYPTGNEGEEGMTASEKHQLLTEIRQVVRDIRNKIAILEDIEQRLRDTKEGK